MFRDDFVSGPRSQRQPATLIRGGRERVCCSCSQRTCGGGRGADHSPPNRARLAVAGLAAVTEGWCASWFLADAWPMLIETALTPPRAESRFLLHTTRGANMAPLLDEGR